MNRTLKDATVKRYFYETHDQLRAHLRDFVDAYNFARRLKTSQRLHPIRVRLQNLDFTARKIQTQPAPANAGTKQLADRGAMYLCKYVIPRVIGADRREPKSRIPMDAMVSG